MVSDQEAFDVACSAIIAAEGGEDPRALTAAEWLADAAEDADDARRGAALKAIFAGVVERLNDRFDPAGRDRYARYFGHMVWRVAHRDAALRSALEARGITDEAGLLERHRRVRTTADRWQGTPRRIAVLSRVTIGADILLTSVLVQRLRATWPAATIVLYGDPKLGGLFGGLPDLELRPVTYARRGGLAERLRAWLPLAEDVADLAPDLVVAPDSRLDQLGLMPLVAEERYLLWENLQVGDARSLVDVLDGWCRERFATGEETILPRLWLDPATLATREALRAALGSRPVVAVKLDHGGNPLKALPRAAEMDLLVGLRERGWRILLDRGFGEAELANSDSLLADLGWNACDVDDSGRRLGRPLAGLTPDSLAAEPLIRFHGSIAGWAAGLATCGLAVSYDSVGHHLAAALGIPLVTAFTGFDHPGFPTAWCPRGPGPVTQVIILTDRRDQSSQWARLLDALPRA